MFNDEQDASDDAERCVCAVVVAVDVQGENKSMLVEERALLRTVV